MLGPTMPHRQSPIGQVSEPVTQPRSEPMYRFVHVGRLTPRSDRYSVEIDHRRRDRSTLPCRITDPFESDRGMQDVGIGPVEHGTDLVDGGIPLEVGHVTGRGHGEH
ncbi:MAG: hypothetical protein ACO4AY_13150, partial [Ilumatobacteraceae bacterium]